MIMMHGLCSTLLLLTFPVWEMYGALLFGGKLVLISDDVAQDPELFFRGYEKRTCNCSKPNSYIFL